jgi:cytochrome c oxidase accessory protein FixG
MEEKRKLHPIRESVTTINQDGSRYFLHPADVRGPFTRWRRIAGLFLIAFFVALPWIQVQGHPALFLDILHRRFHVFGLTFAAQDFWMTYFFITGLGFSLFFLTALFGRLWCGWACPQTVFLDHVFRRVERWIEGDAIARRKLDAAPMDPTKFRKRALKHTVFALLSILIAHIFLSYFISMPELYDWMQHSPLQHWDAFLFICIASVILYFNFSWFREQLCLIICPYGRLQSALIDDDSIIIGYDAQRGNPPGPASRSTAGDCIDCLRCIQVCPTGIDIRQGLQMECIACTNCVDACDTIMEKLGRAKGLVRHDSLNGLAGKARCIIRPRILLYTALLLLGATVLTLSALHLHGMNMNLVRMAGPPYYQTENGYRNQYMVRIINKTNSPKHYKLSVEADHPFNLLGASERVEVPPMGELVKPLVISVKSEDYHRQFPLDITIHQLNPSASITRQVEFLGPKAEMPAHEK